MGLGNVGLMPLSLMNMWHSRLRSLAKALSWRVFASLDTFSLAWLLSGHWTLGVGIAGSEVLTKVALYYAHERAWRHIHARWIE